MGVHQHPTTWVICICEGTIDAEAYVGILEIHMLPSSRQIFPGTACLFQQALILHKLQQCGFVGIECVCLGNGK